MYFVYISKLIVSVILTHVQQKQKADPITGLTSEGYTGPGMVQSPPGLDKYKQDDDE